MLRYAIHLSVMVIVLSTSAGFVHVAAYPQEHVFAVKGVVVDASGAVIQQAEVVFKGESDTIVTHTGMDGSVNVNLEAGRYVVTVSAFGFATAKLVDFPVSGPNADAFRVILRLRPGTMQPSMDANPHISSSPVPSELPNILQDEPTRTSLPVAQPATTKRRSMRCLYLWKCSATRP